MIVIWAVLAVAVLILVLFLAASVFGLIFHFLLTLFLLVLLGMAAFAAWQLVRLGRRVERLLDHIEGRVHGVSLESDSEEDLRPKRRGLLS
jgi:hypothetical protein